MIDLVVAAGNRLPALRLPECPDAVDGNLSQPGPEGPVAAALKFRQFPQDNHKNLLSEVVHLVADAGDAGQPGADQWQIEVLQPMPVRRIRPGVLQPLEQAF